MKFFSLIKKGDVHSTEEKILSPESYSALITTEELIENAREEAAALLEETKQECETLKANAEKEGFQEGLEQLNSAIIALDEEQKKLRHELQRHVLPIALSAAKKIVGKELELFPETIVEIVLQAIAPAAESERITIYVSKKDKEQLEKERPKITSILNQIQLITIQERPDLEPGSCLIKTPKGMINATLENQWAALERALQKYKTTT
jgi:type III secretion protein L